MPLFNFRAPSNLGEQVLSKEFIAQLSGENQILYSADGMTQSPTWEIVEYFLKNTFASLSSDPQNTALALNLLVDVVLGTSQSVLHPFLASFMDHFFLPPDGTASTPCRNQVLQENSFLSSLVLATRQNPLWCPSSSHF